MDKWESIYRVSKYSKIFHKFNKYDLYSIPIVLYNFVLVSFNKFYKKFPCFSALNDFRVLYIGSISYEKSHT